MLPTISPRLVLLPTALLLGLCGCSAGQADAPVSGATTGQPSAVATSAAAATTAPPSTPSASTTPSALTTPSAPNTPSAPPSASTSPSSRVVQRTSAQLKGGLLALEDLPAGFEVDRSGVKDDTRLSSSTKGCAALVRLLNAARLPGSRAEAERSFSGGQEGPYVDETLDAMGSAAAAHAFVEGYRRAVGTCTSVHISIPGLGSSDMGVQEISFGAFGDDTFAARFRAKGGPLDGLEIIQAGVQSGDVVVGTTTVGLDGPDAEAATDDAVTKATKKLGTSGAS